MTPTPRYRAREMSSVTAAIPAYNAERYLGQAIESVLAQTHPCTEIIVVDDGSSDGTAKIAQSFQDVRYIYQYNQGDAGARNRAIREATGDLIAFLDSDDVWTPEKLQRQVEVFQARPDVGMVYTGVVVVDDELNHLEILLPAPTKLALRNTLLVEKPYMTGIGSSGVVRREIASEIGFDERLRASADWAFACRVALKHEVAPVDEALVLYRQHADSQVHLNLRAVEVDMMLTWDELFQDPELPHSMVRQRRRALANLYLSLAASYFKRGDRRNFLRYLAKATGRRADRVVAAFWRRYLGSPT